MKKINFIIVGISLLLSLTACSSTNSESKTSEVTVSQSKAPNGSASTKVNSSEEASSSQKIGQSSTRKTEGSTPAASSSQTSSTTLNFDKLSVNDKNKLYAAWLQNALGQFSVYNPELNTTYFVNEGQNGTKIYKDGKRIGDSYAGISLARELNSAKFVTDANSVLLYVPGPSSSIDGDWSHLKWILQEQILKTDLISRFYQASLKNQQIVETAQTMP
ncbi:hypothetical protein [Lactococcus fujiensis]|nr:hypothetical protein [Lactococcus fujiensis]